MKRCERTEESKVMEGVELHRLFSGGANGNEDINRADTDINDAVIGRAISGLKIPISELNCVFSGFEQRHGSAPVFEHIAFVRHE